MSMAFNARLRRWFHCLTHLHRGETAVVRGVTVYVGCECGYTAYGTRELWDSLWKGRFSER
jgi:hypothetical protein